MIRVTDTGVTRPTNLVLHPRRFAMNHPAINRALSVYNIGRTTYLEGTLYVLPESEMLALSKAVYTSIQHVKTHYSCIDCHDWAFAFKGLVAVNSVGLFLNLYSRHAFNVAFVMPAGDVDADGNDINDVELRFIEPQSDLEMQFNCSPPYTIEPNQYQLIF